MFSLTDHTLKQLRTVYKVNNKFEVQFAASFFVVKLEQEFFAYLDIIKAMVQDNVGKNLLLTWFSSWRVVWKQMIGLRLPTSFWANLDSCNRISSSKSKASVPCLTSSST